MKTQTTTTSIFSLTDQGKVIGDRLANALEGSIHLHRPEEFSLAARAAFEQNHRCVFVCSTGIIIRVLAPVLKDKHTDPPVLALDEQGKFVIPLLSGHEGGASAFGYRIAKLLDGTLVNTTATDYSQPVYCLGVGSDKGCPTELIKDLFESSISALAEPVNISAVASIDVKQNETGILQFADTLSLSLQCYSAEQLRSVEDQLSVRSEIVFNEVGCYGVAEAAALLAATEITGKAAELVITKQKNDRSTISVARSYR